MVEEVETTERGNNDATAGELVLWAVVSAVITVGAVVCALLYYLYRETLSGWLAECWFGVCLAAGVIGALITFLLYLLARDAGGFSPEKANTTEGAEDD